MYSERFLSSPHSRATAYPYLQTQRRGWNGEQFSISITIFNYLSVHPDLILEVTVLHKLVQSPDKINAI